MAEELHKMVDKKVVVMANDGRVFIGMLRGIDQVTNVILEDVEERIFSPNEGVKVENYEVYLCRGDDTAVVALYSDERDAETDWRSCHAEPIKPIVH
ncbi:U6 snRNA-associated Sm-like protein LSm8 [Blastocystis sp. ATCC 50177/Nand II]|uniref:U6 snRNA-associated Sm-like protein LSm8 n=1 Tax=Blastocystis sp. subtype 1 (strain ATCC 50177 / NandII) TaxID=478820 RepID=A0A196SCN2_BLAHN|nr:U6 snRNA-associated Sm-like protein LSm8 [Blastocystis sp. ATCC 50177/Nand II]